LTIFIKWFFDSANALLRQLGDRDPPLAVLRAVHQHAQGVVGVVR
jgi:hypothetical protein